MKADYINPFIQGSQNVLNTLCGEIPALGKLFLKNSPYAAMPVCVSVSIIGAVQGAVAYGMNEQVGCYIASKMMGGMDVSALDAMSQSAISELANMVSGNVATVFSGKGVLVDITPPSFLMNGTAADFPVFIKDIVCIPLSLQNGMVFEIDVWVS